MSEAVTVEATLKEISRRLGTLDQKTNVVMSRAANRAAMTGSKVIRQGTGSRYRINQGDVNATLKTTKATYQNPTAVLTYSDRHRNLYTFGQKNVVKPRFNIRSSRADAPNPPFISASVEKSSAWTALNRDPKPFIRSTRSGNTLVLQRETSDRSAPLIGRSAPAIPQIVKNEDTMEEFHEKTDQMLQKRIDHEIEQILRGTQNLSRYHMLRGLLAAKNIRIA